MKFCWPALSLLLAASIALGAPPQPELTDIVVEPCAEGLWSASLFINGPPPKPRRTDLQDGRVIFDFAPLVWNGPTTSSRNDECGVRAYRWSQFELTGPTVRLVIERARGSACRIESTVGGFAIICSSQGHAGSLTSEDDTTILATVRGLSLATPLADIDPGTFIERSLEYTPRDVVRDGLPHFGAVRDDWKSAPRTHKGIDVYVDGVAVLAAADGVVVGSGSGTRSGGWVKLSHDNNVETVYVHISSISVTQGDRVAQGQRLGAVEGAVGNAVEPQLHFEIKLDGSSVDPVPYMKAAATPALRDRIEKAVAKIPHREKDRQELVATQAE
jgi:hypothetical protein